MNISICLDRKDTHTLRNVQVDLEVGAKCGPHFAVTIRTIGIPLLVVSFEDSENSGASRC